MSFDPTRFDWSNHFDPTDAAILFFQEDETGYGFMCELLNSDKSNTQCVEAAQAFFPVNAFTVSSGNHIQSKFFHHLLVSSLKCVDWYTVIRTCMQMSE